MRSTDSDSAKSLSPPPMPLRPRLMFLRPILGGHNPTLCPPRSSIGQEPTGRRGHPLRKHSSALCQRSLKRRDEEETYGRDMRPLFGTPRARAGSTPRSVKPARCAGRRSVRRRRCVGAAEARDLGWTSGRWGSASGVRGRCIGLRAHGSVRSWVGEEDRTSTLVASSFAHSVFSIDLLSCIGATPLVNTEPLEASTLCDHLQLSLVVPMKRRCKTPHPPDPLPPYFSSPHRTSPPS